LNCRVERGIETILHKSPPKVEPSDIELFGRNG